MSDINVNTQSVRNAVSALTNINNTMESEFDSVKNAISNLNNSWDGTASGKAISKFNKIKSDYCGGSGRKAGMNNYIKFLREAVAMGYEGTEDTNVKLSELFK